ncbi:MAG: short-chain fatty acyl-CoA regulator family protein, partial [Pseudomonadota bacterium]
LIEHNRRRIAPDLLSRLAGALDIDVAALSDGADAPLITSMVEAATNIGQSSDASEAQAMAERFPKWAQVIAAQQARISQSDAALTALSDRMAHDPFFADTMHEIVSTVSAIQSTAAILADPDGMDGALERRFRENMAADTTRLSDATRGLSDYLMRDASVTETTLSPHDELFRHLGGMGFHHPALERRGANATAFAAKNFAGLSAAAQAIAQGYMSHYIRLARLLPLDVMMRALDQYGYDIMALSRSLDVGFTVLFYRMATLPPKGDGTDVGLVVADAAGRLLHRQPCDGFDLPRGGVACGLWPLFRALQHPGQAHKAVLSQYRRAMAGAKRARAVAAYAVAEPMGTVRFDQPPLHRAVMLLVPANDATSDQTVGVACRICQQSTCSARGEPSILSNGF